MKTICKLSILMLAVAFAACRNEMDDLNNSDREIIELNGIVIVVDNGVIQSPKWLAHAYDSISRSHNPYMPDARRPVLIYSVKYGDQEYILLVDGFDSCGACGEYYYTLSGELVDKSSDLFDYLLTNDPDERNYICFPRGN